jgi:hypothetical protein
MHPRSYSSDSGSDSLEYTDGASTDLSSINDDICLETPDFDGDSRVDDIGASIQRAFKLILSPTGTATDHESSPARCVVLVDY